MGKMQPPRWEWQVKYRESWITTAETHTQVGTSAGAGKPEHCDNLPEVQCWQLTVKNIGRIWSQGVPTILWDFSPGACPGSHGKGSEIPLYFGRGREQGAVWNFLEHSVLNKVHAQENVGNRSLSDLGDGNAQLQAAFIMLKILRSTVELTFQRSRLIQPWDQLKGPGAPPPYTFPPHF